MARIRLGLTGRAALRVLLTLVSLTLAAVVAVLSVHPPSHTSIRDRALSTALQWGLHDAVIKNSPQSTTALTVCADWAGLGCKQAGGESRDLAPGQDTRTAFGWKDADGLLVRAGCTVQITGDDRTPPVRGPRWFKVVGFFGVQQELTYTCHR